MFGLPLSQRRRGGRRSSDPSDRPTSTEKQEPTSPVQGTEPPDADVAAEEDQAPIDPERESLVNRARAGDAEAFGQIYDLYVDTVFHYVYYRTSDRGLAEDLTSETFLRAWRRIDTFVWQGRDIGAWLVRISRNLLFDHMKSSRYKLEMTTAELVEPSQSQVKSTEDLVISAAVTAELLDHIKQLSADQQECLVLRFFEGMSVAETAAIMGKQVGAVKALQHRAVRRLTAAINPEPTT